jgi:hypothetical protein
MKTSFRLHIESGGLFAVDPYFLDSEPDSPGRVLWREELARASSPIDFLSRSEFFGHYDSGLPRGEYNFPLNALRNAARHPRDPAPAEVFKVEKWIALIADVAYLGAILENYSWQLAVDGKTWKPRAAYERTLSERIGLSEESAFVQVPAVWQHHFYEFNGEGDFYLNIGALTKAPKRRGVETRRVR